jgi:hypothetical protein
MTPDRLEQANRFIEKQLAKKGETIDSLGEAREVTRPPGRTPGLVVRQALPHCFIRQQACAAKPPLLLRRLPSKQSQFATLH